MSASASLRFAAILLWLSTMCLGLPCLLVIRSLLAGKGILVIMGYPTYGGGPFERHGIRSSVWLITAFLVVCVLEGIAGWLLWGGHRAGAILALALLPIGALFWWGFALPVPPLVAVARTILIVLGWRALK